MGADGFDGEADLRLFVHCRPVERRLIEARSLPAA
jgi:hypothetical protein